MEFVDVPVLERPSGAVARSGYWEAFLTTLGVLDPPPSVEGGKLIDCYSIVSKGMPNGGTMNLPILGARTPPAGTLLTLDRRRLSNFLHDLGTNHDSGVIGPVVWLYREGLGRFLFSTAARPGFLKTAVAHGALLKFSEQTGHPYLEMYSAGLRSSAIPAQGAWMIWVKHEPDFHPPPGGPWTKEELKNGTLALGIEK
jgi:hypothetical protein